MRPKHLFSCNDGALYDTRNLEWSRERPLRPVYCRPARDICDTADLRAALRSGPYMTGFRHGADAHNFRSVCRPTVVATHWAGGR